MSALNLQMDVTASTGFKSPSRIAGVVTEAWAAKHLYCVACNSPSLDQSATNTRAVDFICPNCQAAYQLKSRRTWTEGRITDAGYKSMMDRIDAGLAPNLLVMHYTPKWTVARLLLVPGFFFTASAIHKRKPLGPKARRAGWVGCDILLSEIAPNGRIDIIRGGTPYPAHDVRGQYQKIKPLAQLSLDSRGWVLDVLACVHQLNTPEFTLAQVYAFASHLSALHPENNNVEAKIRQQLQVLRDNGLVEFLERGHYRLKS